jgi:putative tryptophan/tyrosine transport system substrate-binding protein
MGRREFITLLATAAACWTVSARAQQSAMPVVGFLSGGSPAAWAAYVAAFRKGLNDTGFTEGHNVTIDFRWADGHYDRLADLAAGLINRKVAVLFAAGGSEPVKTAKAATSATPIVFASALDPVRAGIVVSINRPEGNVTGVSMLGSALEAKRLGLLTEIVPGAGSIGVLINPNYEGANLELHELQEAAHAIKRQIDIVRAGTDTEIDAAFMTLAQHGAVALVVAEDPFLGTRSEHLVQLAARFKLPTIYYNRTFVKAGGLASYGTDFADVFRQAGVYVGKILKGARPADLPVLQPTKFEFVINLKTAKLLGLTVPFGLLNAADEVVE